MEVTQSGPEANEVNPSLENISHVTTLVGRLSLLRMRRSDSAIAERRLVFSPVIRSQSQNRNAQAEFCTRSAFEWEKVGLTGRDGGEGDVECASNYKCAG